ncbi:MAG: 50S ribosomal protein L11 methyltransferase [Clostridia bacterium]|nr:50S ribosomal protein L11 methyltransferase [Clostridia bacterium]MBR6742595.1 50S ribosomal protein L11 methyltransferase [Clostridia bacterium]
MEQQWTQLKLVAKAELLDTLVAIMSRIDPALVIEDYRDVGPDPVYGELIDESILNADKTVCSVSLYLPAGSEQVMYARDYVRGRIEALGIEAELTLAEHSTDEWENSWKKYYHVQHIGKVTILPAWEEYTPKDDEVVITMDPGMAFGTGTHETTRLVIGMLQDYMFGGAKMLDVGTGSGILSICASKLGAEVCAAYDLDPDAVRVAKENTEKNGTYNVECGVSDLLKSVTLKYGKYTLVCANIVADIIVKMLPELYMYTEKGAVCILSGIINTAEEQVQTCLDECGYKVVERRTDGDWVALAVKLK